MRFNTARRCSLFSVAFALAIVGSIAGGAIAAAADVWIDPQDSTLPPDFKIQGEYATNGLGAQVIALGNSSFQAVVYPGGLPGDGWDGKNKILLSGKLEGGKLTLKAAEGSRSYMAQSPDQFSATSTYPSPGQKAYTADIDADGAQMSGKTEDGKAFELKKTMRKSPTLGEKAPQGAIVLFDGSNTDAWNNAHLDTKQKGALNTEHGDAVTKQKFKNYTAHLEFFLPFRPDARSQGRGNSGFYQVDHYEIQVLDSFGLDGKNNECGGVYTKAAPTVNMCYPPMTWQTYDVDFTAPETDASGKKTKNARLTLKHNGVMVHDNVEIDGPTGGARSEPEGTPGPLKIQGHGNPVLYRNIWVAEKQ